MPTLNLPTKQMKTHDYEITLMVKSKSAEDKTEAKLADDLPDLSMKRCDSDGNFTVKPTGRPRFMNSKMKSKGAETTMGDIQELLENVPKMCPQETLKVFTEYIKKGLDQIKHFVDAIFEKAVNTEKRYQSTTYAEILRILMDSEKEKQKNPNHYVFLLRRCLLRKIQDVYEDQNLLLMEKSGKTEANELEQSLHKLLFLDFLKALHRAGVLNHGHIRNSLIILLVIFFNDNARAMKNCPSMKKTAVSEAQMKFRNKNLEFRLHFTLELILSFLAILFKGPHKSHDENIERIKKENYSFYEDFFCKGHEEQLIHNFSKDLLKIFNIFKENYDVSWLVIKEIFTVNNDYLIIMENDVQKLKIKKFRLLDNVSLSETMKNQ